MPFPLVSASLFTQPQTPGSRFSGSAGQLSWQSWMPSPSVSPTAGQASRQSGMPSPSVSVRSFDPGQLSQPSNKPSPSVSVGQPVALTDALAQAGVPRHASASFFTPSPSSSAVEQPFAFTGSPAKVPGQVSQP